MSQDDDFIFLSLDDPSKDVTEHVMSSEERRKLLQEYLSYPEYVRSFFKYTMHTDGHSVSMPDIDLPGNLADYQLPQATFRLLGAIQNKVNPGDYEPILRRVNFKLARSFIALNLNGFTLGVDDNLEEYVHSTSHLVVPSPGQIIAGYYVCPNTCFMTGDGAMHFPYAIKLNRTFPGDNASFLLSVHLPELWFGAAQLPSLVSLAPKGEASIVHKGLIEVKEKGVVTSWVDYSSGGL